jgi:hypothetical protein
MRKIVVGTIPAFSLGTDEIYENLRRDNQCPRQDSNQSSPEHKAEALPVEPA